ncbi:hypothetical protein JYU34_011724 [Plutella xylostella]|uniref:Secreted protein n=1 Tax=Plutella xylostella TaxID=51655 RepID=A0ABQ7QDG1_PLUXY|nr:hypothetical protein JYU34_011724 [Plutella xylostella]
MVAGSASPPASHSSAVSVASSLSVSRLLGLLVVAAYLPSFPQTSNTFCTCLHLTPLTFSDMVAGSASPPASHSSAVSVASSLSVSGYRSSWNSSDLRGTVIDTT